VEEGGVHYALSPPPLAVSEDVEEQGLPHASRAREEDRRAAVADLCGEVCEDSLAGGERDVAPRIGALAEGVEEIVLVRHGRTALFLLCRELVKASTRGRLQEARLNLCAVAATLALGCADPLVRRLVETAEPPPAASETESWIRYIVQPGETLGGIAACRRTSLSELARANRISAPDRLRAGAVLRVPPGDGCAATPLVRNAPVSRHAKAEGLLASATSAYDGADFEQALSRAGAAIEAVAPYSRGNDARADAIRARCHVVAGMAAAGLEQRERAIVEFRHALDLAPDLALDPDRSSPRVLELVELARERPAGSGHFVETSTR